MDRIREEQRTKKMEDLKNIKNSAEKEISSADNIEEIRQVFQKYLGKKGEITLVLRSLKDLPEKDKKEVGRLANQIKKDIEQKIEIREKAISAIIGRSKLKKQRMGKLLKAGVLTDHTECLQNIIQEKLRRSEKIP